MNAYTHLKEVLPNTEIRRLAMVDAYFPIKVWIEKQYDQIEKPTPKPLSYPLRHSHLLV